MARRLEPPKDPVAIEHDGDRLVAERGEPLAHALIAADRLLLARSPKLHRPRGPYCLRGACDGCLARVNGVPNVMTCLRPAFGGERVETQNVLGTRGVDMLRATDFLFPRGMDHHRLFAGVRGLSSVVQKFARRVAGLGRLPSDAGSLGEARQSDADVLVVGAGAAGLAAAAELSGFAARVADDALVPGGSLGLVDPPAAAHLLERARAAGARVQTSTTVAALLREPQDAEGRLFALLASDRGAELVRTRAAILAPGGHDPVIAFENDDLPGVMSARAALRLLRGGIVLGDRVAVVGTGRFSDALEASGRVRVVPVGEDALVRAAGRSRVTTVIVRDGEREKRLEIDALLIEGPLAPSFELAAQAGAEVRFDASGYVPVADEAGRVAPGVWFARAASGRAVGRNVAAALADSSG
jgi:sarcosine oxidase subunit alpha